MPYLRPGADTTSTKNGKGRALTMKMESFVQHYLVCQNASEAVRLAGYKTKNAHKMGAELLRHPLVKAAVDDGKQERRERMELTADWILNRLVDITQREGIRTADEIKAIELLGKSLALWKERQEISGVDGKAIETEQRIREDVNDFTSSLRRLAKRSGTDGVVEFPNPGRDS
jgi:phage terminase small subunit